MTTFSHAYRYKSSRGSAYFPHKVVDHWSYAKVMPKDTIFLGCHQVFLLAKTGLLSSGTCATPKCGLEVQYPKVKTFQDISSIIDHLLPCLRIQVVKRISLFSLQGSGPLVLQKGFFKGHNPLGLSPTLSFDQDLFPVSLIITIL